MSAAALALAPALFTARLQGMLAWLDAEGYRTVVPDEDVQRDTSIVTA